MLLLDHIPFQRLLKVQEYIVGLSLQVPNVATMGKYVAAEDINNDHPRDL